MEQEEIKQAEKIPIRIIKYEEEKLGKIRGRFAVAYGPSQLKQPEYSPNLPEVSHWECQ